MLRGLGDFSIDVKPRVVIHSPAGDVVVDPWAGGGETNPTGGVVNIGGIEMPYDIVWGVPNLLPGQELGGASVFNALNLGTYLPLILLGVGAVLLFKGR